MKKNKIAGLLLFGFIFLIASSMIAFNVTAQNWRTGSCTCHAETANVSLTVLNQTTINLEGKTQFVLICYATTSVAGANLTLRFISTASISTSPEMIVGDSGVFDGGGLDPDSLTNDEVGNSTDPLVINVTNAPTDFTIGILAVAKLQMAMITITFGDVESTWEWFLRTQLPILIAIGIIFGLAIFASLLTRKK